VEIAAAIADALAEIHAHGLVHRDVKPGNVLMASDGSVKVADLGIAEATRSRGAGRSPALGTPGYASPEQVRGDAVDGRADLYALGVIVYEMLTGRLPFDAESDPTPRRGKPIPPSRVGAAVPSALDAVVLTALAERPDARFPSIAAFRGALLEAAGGPPTVPSGSLRMGPSGAHRAARPGRWRRVAAAAFAMLLLVLAGSWLAAGTPFPGGGTSPNGLPAVSPSSTPARTTPAPAVDVVPTDGPSPSVGGVAVPPPTAEAEGDDGERDDEGGEEPCDNRGPGNCEDRGDGHGEGGGHHSD
jgi:serine/threonine protein kinase